MDSVAAQPLHAEEKGDGRLELRRQEQHLEVEEGLLVHREVGLAWGRRWSPSEGLSPRAARPQAEPGVPEGRAGRDAGLDTEDCHRNPTWFRDLL